MELGLLLKVIYSVFFGVVVSWVVRCWMSEVDNGVEGWVVVCCVICDVCCVCIVCVLGYCCVG